ncbi:MAG TPA: hypothetical protein VI874_03050, partial [Candidatus Norongarragalinales archaeon]|nr:hypothetical protein [Candidatus Norongarragalinales archaeon]
YELGTNIDRQIMAVAVVSLSSGKADLDFISFDEKSNKDPEPTPAPQTYYNSFKDPDNPTPKEAYYFNSGNCQDEEGTTRQRNSYCINLRNDAKIAFFWFYPDPTSSAYNKQGTLADHVTAFVFPNRYSSDNGIAVRLDLGKEVDIGPFLTGYGSYAYPSKMKLKLVKADLSQEGEIQVFARSYPAKTNERIQLRSDHYFNKEKFHEVCAPVTCGEMRRLQLKAVPFSSEQTLNIPSNDFRATLTRINEKYNRPAEGDRVTVNGLGPIYSMPSACMDVPQTAPHEPFDKKTTNFGWVRVDLDLANLAKQGDNKFLISGVDCPGPQFDRCVGQPDGAVYQRLCYQLRVYSHEEEPGPVVP